MVLFKYLQVLINNTYFFFIHNIRNLYNVYSIYNTLKITSKRHKILISFRKTNGTEHFQNIQDKSMTKVYSITKYGILKKNYFQEIIIKRNSVIQKYNDYDINQNILTSSNGNIY